MLARRNRFHGYHSLRPVYQRGRAIRGRLFSLRALQNNRRSTFRAAVVVSKKVHKSAVVRNRIRRRLYEQLRTQLTPATTDDLIVLVFSPEVATMSADKLAADLSHLLEQRML